jgi:hypothetical protein
MRSFSLVAEQSVIEPGAEQRVTHRIAVDGGPTFTGEAAGG